MKTFKLYIEEDTMEESWKSAVAGVLMGAGAMTGSLSDVSGAEHVAQTQTQSNFDNILKLILKHEGLLPKQTPFRITNNTMRKWSTIHGFKIDKSAIIPANRKNFIFLQKASDVPKAVKKQFQNYATKPARYGLPTNVTLKDALLKFDQTGASGKMKYLIKKIPNLDLNQPLISFLT